MINIINKIKSDVYNIINNKYFNNINNIFELESNYFYITKIYKNKKYIIRDDIYYYNYFDNNILLINIYISLLLIKLIMFNKNKIIIIDK